MQHAHFWTRTVRLRTPQTPPVEWRSVTVAARHESEWTTSFSICKLSYLSQVFKKVFCKTSFFFHRASSMALGAEMLVCHSICQSNTCLRNILTTAVWTGVNFSTHIHGIQMMNPENFGHRLSFHQVLSPTMRLTLLWVFSEIVSWSNCVEWYNICAVSFHIHLF